jgi:N-methylhydantoinase B
MNSADLQVHRYRLAGIAEEMGKVLQRTAFSPNIKERRDFSCALCDRQGRLVAQAAHIPVHLGALPATMRAFLDQVDPKPEVGYLLNDPYAGGTHLPDLSMIQPVLLDERIQGYLVNRAHHTDVGGTEAGSMTPTDHIDREGFRTGPRAISYSGQLDFGQVEDLLETTRTPSQRRTDLEAQQAALTWGVERFQEWQRGLEHPVSSVFEKLMEYSRRFTRNFLSRLPNRSVAVEDVLDDDGFGHREIPIRAELTVEDEEVTVDYTDTADQVPGNLNCPRAVTLSASYYVLCGLLEKEVPVNQGLFDPLSVRSRSGSLLDVEYPGAVAAGNVETSQRIVDVLLRGFDRLVPGSVPAASQGTMNNVTLGATVEGEHRSYYETLGGGAGGGPENPGVSGRQVHMTNTQNTPIEEFERRFPLRIDRLELREGSGGDGAHAGGEGLVKSWTALEPVTVSLLTERRLHEPYGLRAEDGEPGENSVRKSGPDEILPGKTSITLEADETLTLETPGGGGWSPPDDGEIR